MDRVPVRSRSLRSIGYESESESLELEFQSGRVYVYSGVPETVHAWLMRVPDKGGFFNRTIRDRYPWRDVTGAGEPEPDLIGALQDSLRPKD